MLGGIAHDRADRAFDWRNISTVSNEKEEKHMNAANYAMTLGYYISTGEFGIKALKDGCFALLYIPHGAIVHVDGNSDYYRRFYGLMLDSKNGDDRWNDGVKETRKHRTNKAYVVAICKSEITRQEFVNEYTAGEKFEIKLKDVLEGRSIQDAQFEYITDWWISIDDYSIDGDEACAAGIHYFPGWKAAIEYHIRTAHARSLFGFSRIITNQDPYADSKRELAENMLPMILPNWMEHKISEFKCVHDDIYECSYDHEGRTLFKKMNYKHPAALSEAFKELNDAARALADKICSEEPMSKLNFERAYLCKRMTGQPPKKTAILKQQGNLTVYIGCNIYNGIPVEDEKETENDDDEPP